MHSFPLINIARHIQFNLIQDTQVYISNGALENEILFHAILCPNTIPCFFTKKIHTNIVTTIVVY